MERIKQPGSQCQFGAALLTLSTPALPLEQQDVRLVVSAPGCFNVGQVSGLVALRAPTASLRLRAVPSWTGAATT